MSRAVLTSAAVFLASVKLRSSELAAVSLQQLPSSCSSFSNRRVAQPSGLSAWHHRGVDAVRSISSPAHLHHVSAVTVIRIMQVLLDSDIFVGFFA